MELPLLTMPGEILTCIFKACKDFPQIVAFALTCKYTHVAWVAASPTVIWSVGNHQIRSFDDALITVRATAVVLKAYQTGTLPPAVTAMSSLSGKSKVPNLAELKEVLNMQRLVRYIEYMYFYSSRAPEFSQYFPLDNPGEIIYFKYPADRRRFPDCLKENIPGTENATIDSFRDSFYRAMFRVLLAGAVLAKAYMEPLFRARQETDKVTKNGFFHCWGSEDYWSQGFGNLGYQSGIDDDPIEADIMYIRQSPVYNFDVPDWTEIGQWKNQEYEVCFGRSASWIIEDGRKRKMNELKNPNDVEPSWARDSADIGAVRELMLLLVAYDHLNDHFEQRYGSPKQKQGNRSVTIVRLGVFQVEKITMPATVEDLRDTDLYAEKIHPALVGTKGEDIPLQFDSSVTSWRLKGATRSPIHTTGSIQDHQ